MNRRPAHFRRARSQSRPVQRTQLAVIAVAITVTRAMAIFDPS